MQLIDMSLYERIREARKTLQVTQKDAASESGLRQGDISRLESGVSKFVPTEYIEWLVQKDINIVWVFTGEGNIMEEVDVAKPEDIVKIDIDIDFDTADTDQLIQIINQLKKENSAQKAELLELYRERDQISKVLKEKFNLS